MVGKMKLSSIFHWNQLFHNSYPCGISSYESNNYIINFFVFYLPFYISLSRCQGWKNFHGRHIWIWKWLKGLLRRQYLTGFGKRTMKSKNTQFDVRRNNSQVIRQNRELLLLIINEQQRYHRGKRPDDIINKEQYNKLKSSFHKILD